MRTKNMYFFSGLSTILPIVLLSTFTLAQVKKELTIVTFGNSTTAPRKGIEKVYAFRIPEALTEAGILNKAFNSAAFDCIFYFHSNVTYPIYKLHLIKQRRRIYLAWRTGKFFRLTFPDLIT